MCMLKSVAWSVQIGMTEDVVCVEKEGGVELMEMVGGR